MKTIPIFIVNFNRFQPLKNLVESLLKRNYNNIAILDNHSEYPPLLDWYSKCPVAVVRLERNVHSGVLNLLQEFKPITTTGLYVYSDGDVLPVDEAPDDFIDHMVEIVKEYNIPKLGLSLKIDDLPDHYKYKNEVIAHETQFSQGPYIDTKHCRIYKAAVDTTFAVCATPDCGLNMNAYRTGWPYAARHIPWYYDSNNLPEDEKLLKARKHAQIGHWSSKEG
jgi:hypothetical protein